MWKLPDGTVWMTGTYLGPEATGDPRYLFDYEVYFPTLIESIGNDVVEIAAGGEHYLALLEDGTVWGWGRHHEGQLGNWNSMYGDPDRYNWTPELITEGCRGISASESASFFIKDDGTLWGLSDNPMQLGIYAEDYDSYIYGSFEEYDPTAQLNLIPGPENVVKVRGQRWSGEDVFALTEDGVLWAWGDNGWGSVGKGLELATSGIGAGNYFPEVQGWPIPVPDMTGVTDFDTFGNHVVAAREDGSAWAWGSALNGQLGIGDPFDYEEDDCYSTGPLFAYHACPREVQDVSNVVEVKAADWHSIFIESDGTIKMSGENFDGPFGIGDETGGEGEDFPSYHPSPITVDWPSYVGNITGIFAGQYNTWLVNDECEIYSMGAWNDGIGGTGGQEFSDEFYNPTLVVLDKYRDPPIPGPAAADVRAGGNSSMLRAVDGDMYGWGDNSDGQVGIDSPQSAFTAFAEKFDAPPLMLGAGQKLRRRATGEWEVVVSELTPPSRQLESASPLTLEGQGPTSTLIHANGLAGHVLKPGGELWGWGNNALYGVGFPDEGSTHLHPELVDDTLASATKIEGGDGNLIALMGDGTLQGFGANTSGQLGCGDFANHPPWVDVGEFDDIIDIAAGVEHTLILRDNGEVWAAGSHTLGSLGIGDDDGPDPYIPKTNPDYEGTTNENYFQNFQQVLDLPANIVGVGAGWDISYAFTDTGAVYAWGDNRFGQLGLGHSHGPHPEAAGILFYTLPQLVPGVSDVTQVKAGDGFVIVLKSDGTLMGTGLGDLGEMGDGEQTTYEDFTAIPDLDNVTYIDTLVAASTAFALKEDDTLWAWGDNFRGQCGLGEDEPTEVLVPTQCAITNVAKVAAGGAESMALKNDCSVWAWGDNGLNFLGMEWEDLEMSSTPIEIVLSRSLDVDPVSGVADVRAGGNASLLRMPGGEGYGWGDNESGQLGIDEGSAPVGLPSGIFEVPPLGMMGLKEGMSLRLNSRGEWEVVRGEPGPIDTPRTSLEPLTATGDPGDPTNVDMQFGWQNGAILKADGTVWVTGTYGISTPMGQEMSEAGDNLEVPEQVPSLEDVVKIDFADVTGVAVKSDGTAWIWGRTSRAYFEEEAPPGPYAVELPLGSTTTPVQITQFDDVVDAFVSHIGFSVWLVRADGSVWAWGENDNGQLGVGHQDEVDGSAQQVVGVSNVVRISTSQDFAEITMFLQADGALFTCGEPVTSNYPLLGQGGPQGEYPSTPVQVLSDVVSADMGDIHVVAIKSNGEVWGWGVNINGELGDLFFDSESTTRDVPTHLELGTGWTQVACGAGTTHLLDENGELWGMGYGNGDEAGEIDRTSLQLYADGAEAGGIWHSYMQITPKKYEVFTDPIVKLCTGSYWTQAAVDSACGLWSWGRNYDGELGNGGIVDHDESIGYPTTAEPHLVVASRTLDVDPLSDVSEVRSGGVTNAARQGGGDMFGWGGNESSQIGDEGQPPVAIPLTAFGDITDWQMGLFHTLVLLNDGTVQAIGGNQNGQLGDGSGEDSDELVDTGLTGITKIIASTYSMALKNDGTVWAWGAADGFEKWLGTGFTDMEPQPDNDIPNLVVGAASDEFPVLGDVTDLWSGWLSTWARTSTGLIYMWGMHNMIADSPSVSDPGEYTMPRMEGGEDYDVLAFDFVPDDYSFPFTAATIADIQFGEGFAIMLRTDGNLVSFGDPETVSYEGHPSDDYYGQLGRPHWSGMVEDRDDHFLPTEIPDISGVAQVACGKQHAAALLDDGTVWTWGRGSSGQLGNDDFELSDFPTQVVGEDGDGFLTGIVQISCGSDHTLALDGDGMVWAWGAGSDGQLGDGLSQDSATPVNVGVAGSLGEIHIVEEFDACGTFELEEVPENIPDPIPTMPPSGPLPIPNADIITAPGEMPYIEMPLPPNIPLPAPGDPFELTPPNTPNLQVPGTVDNIQMPEPPADMCNTGMPAPAGGLCGGAGGQPGSPSAGQQPGSPGTRPGGGTRPGRPPVIGGPGNGGGGPGGGGPGGGGGNSQYFAARTCYTDKLIPTIVGEMANMLNIATPVFTPPCTEKYTGCFEKGTSIFTAMRKLVQICIGSIIIDPGDPPVVVPPEPNNVHHYLHEDVNIFFMDRVYDAADLYHHVEVFRPALYANGEILVPAVSKTSLIDSPFDPPETSFLPIPNYDYNLTEAQLQNVATAEAASRSGQGARVQVRTLYKQAFHLYDQLHIIRPSINWYTRWMIREMQHSFSDEGHLTIMEATWLGTDSPSSMTANEILGIPEDGTPPGSIPPVPIGAQVGYPSPTLYPSDTLYPREGGGAAIEEDTRGYPGPSTYPREDLYPRDEEE
jgi:alpha-tubulin suppressor-like RCC1 family protein